MREVVHLAERAAVQIQGNALPRAEEVRIRVAAVELELISLRVADAAPQLSARALLELVVHIHQIRRAGDRRGLVLDRLHIGQALDALLRALQGSVGEPAALELAQLTTQDLVIDSSRA